MVAIMRLNMEYQLHLQKDCYNEPYFTIRRRAFARSRQLCRSMESSYGVHLKHALIKQVKLIGQLACNGEDVTELVRELLSLRFQVEKHGDMYHHRYWIKHRARHPRRLDLTPSGNLDPEVLRESIRPQAGKDSLMKKRYSPEQIVSKLRQATCL